MTNSYLDDNANTVFDQAMIAELAAFGREENIDVGDVLYRAGDPAPDFYVILDGEVTIVRPGDSEVQVARWGRGAFLGELNLLTGQYALMNARVTQPGRVLHIEHSTFRQLMSTKPEFSDIVFRAYLARRSILRAGDGSSAIR